MVAMDASPSCASPFEILAPARQLLPLVVASPHSGACYPDDLIEASRLDPLSLRKSEDCFVQLIFAGAPALGVPLLHALFPRAYIDPNREPYELDPVMFEDKLPAFVNSHSPRVAVGLGTIARVVADGEPIYRRKLRFAEAETRIRQLYRPYHAALERLVEETVRHFGGCVLIDAHSMPSTSTRAEAGRRRVDFVLGDRLGTSCHGDVTRAAEACLKSKGYSVALNTPYAGGFTTRHYGRPIEGQHCLQIEINRALYMDERSLAPKPYLDTLRIDMAELLAALGQLNPAQLKAA
ncbi:MAG TPA: N-formylglutamate amidohydrolase [Aliidongia sp.]|nr:N-formylglutamate amidohydrolase [Aliidongia sp.]